MAFTSYIFLFIFFPLCVVGYLLAAFIENRIKRAWTGISIRLCDIYIIAVGIAFYAWAGLNGALFLTGYILLTYILGKLIERNRTTIRTSKKDGTETAIKSRVFIAVSVLLFVGVLFVYKYLNFSFEVLGSFTPIHFDALELIVPLGISFITFSAISYVVDIYRGDVDAGNIIDAALYLTFFPKVVSGPIVLWKEFRPQMQKRSLSEKQFLEGWNRIVVGYAKKVILADSFGAVIVDMENNLLYGGGMDAPTAWLCALLYMMQIYYDFAGYSDIAIGLSEMFGFSVKENFHFPYISASITEFWRRWHISLGTWFREYIYIPLGGNRKGRNHTLLNLFIVFLVTGIWHGAGWNYILWGILNGVCVVLERCVREKLWYRKIPYIFKWFVTMFVVFISWEIFRLPGISEIVDFFKIMFGVTQFAAVDCTWGFYLTPKILAMLCIAVVGATLLHKTWVRKIYDLSKRSEVLFIVKEVILLLLMVLVMMFLVNSTYSPFIYFQY